VPPASPTIAMSLARWLPTSSCPGFTESPPTSRSKVWALGVYQGLRRKYLQSYLDEFVFRFNRRRTRHAAFRSPLGIAAALQPRPYKILISRKQRYKA
jgi:hypothetical protein